MSLCVSEKQEKQLRELSMPVRISNSFSFFPSHFLLPTTKPRAQQPTKLKMSLGGGGGEIPLIPFVRLFFSLHLISRKCDLGEREREKEREREREREAPFLLLFPSFPLRHRTKEREREALPAKTHRGTWGGRKEERERRNPQPEKKRGKKSPLRGEPGFADDPCRGASFAPSPSSLFGVIEDDRGSIGAQPIDGAQEASGGKSPA